MKKSRHEFLNTTIKFLFNLPIISLIGNSKLIYSYDKIPSIPEGETPVSESEATASALGFHHDAKKTDFKKFPERKKTSSKNDLCKFCSQYNKLNDGWGKCNILNQGVVSSSGWCSAYTKKE